MKSKLVTFLESSEADRFFGRAFVIKAAVLAHVKTGKGTLTSIAAKHGVGKSALTRHARRAREIFGPGTQKVD